MRAWLADCELNLGSPQRRAVLLLCGKRVVAEEELVDAVWGENPPPAAVSVLRTYASRLRKVLEPDRGHGEPPRVLVSVGGGYVLRIPDSAVDVRVNEQRAAEARKA
ncbi:helix-turn-helix domain-containing protein [Streptomyces sp. TG1A-8]|uniref:AfsR/SARP family transcriptional regulator n=1 Tax=Streptomyces sp. TG1A-8 TaxID=3051385 RepID=UPI00265BD776|nr:helix-turn-helix domain-containing protein [Streptomyces sp. TG1A-8]MDO0929945.1 helix-turn-helix domain-containing protein [Streptomyces sp. TG1A-8]